MSYRNSERKTHDIDAMTTNAVAFARVMMLTTRRPRPRRRLPSSRVEDEERSVDIGSTNLSLCFSLWCACAFLLAFLVESLPMMMMMMMMTRNKYVSNLYSLRMKF